MDNQSNPEGAAKLGAGMPPLPLDASLRSKRDLGIRLGVHGPREPRGKQIADGFVRLVDKTVLEYQATRERMFRYICGDGYRLDYHRAEDHWESCVQSLHRAVNYLIRLRGMGYRDADGTPLVPRARAMDVLSESSISRIKKFRDLLEHLDDDIIDQRFPPDADPVHKLLWDRAVLGGATLAYSDVARWSTQLFNIAGPLSYVTMRTGPVEPD
ncbi:hypothetical protein SRS16CHR_03561 [Variovorax sp. SRS16]|uniref:hypothetical protein n=1 Tax=Variovorax sp. SRS16 TaxID=282217 RepID=UPI001319307B|nr:hypothetical protein [Variovorax sp. SRS16]VTU24949.1 hypothetical protein SRS16CHR_03561 [Variovorax sp. SRS16]